jgi:hypothetical protein
MATYDELLAIAQTDIGGPLKNKIKVAVVVACDVIRAEAEATPNHANRLTWAAQTLSNPGRAAEQMVWAVLATNRTLTAGQITGASDANVQTAVNAAVDLVARG